MNCPYCGEPDAKSVGSEIFKMRFTRHGQCSWCGEKFMVQFFEGMKTEYFDMEHKPIERCEKAIVYIVDTEDGPFVFRDRKNLVDAEVLEGLSCMLTGNEYTVKVRKVAMSWAELEALPEA